jgi:beta-galactosidase
MQPQVIGRPREDGRIPTAEDVRYWKLVSFMGGATGLLYPRWRPLLDGPLFGAFGPYGMDGEPTPRSEMTGRLARWANADAQQDLWRSHPVRGEIGVLYVPEAQLFTYAQQGDTGFYARSVFGAYQGFFDRNVQADWVHIDDADLYDLLYLPFPVMLTQQTADRLKAWVAAGGVLISEGCPGYFGDGAHVGTTQPNLGLDELFGAREEVVEFTPDLLDDLQFQLDGAWARGGIFMQSYRPTTGEPVGWYGDGRVAAVDHTYGGGKTRLLGTMCGAGYGAHPEDCSPALFAGLMRFAAKGQHVTSSDGRVKARLHDGAGGIYLWVANPERRSLPVRLELSSTWGPFSTAQSLWGTEASVDGQAVSLIASPRDVAVLCLE